MINIRTNVFETNSSSVHSLTLCSEDDYSKWQDGKLLYVYERYMDITEAGKNLDFVETSGMKMMYVNKDFVTLEEAAILDKNYPYPEPALDSWGYYNLFEFEDENEKIHYRNFLTYKEFFDIFDYFEHFEEQRTIDGKEVVAFGYYGHDG